MYGSHPDRKPVTVKTLAQLKESGEKITALTAYDSSFAALLEQAGVEVVLIGDSLGMVMQGQKTTLPVTVDHIVYHTQCVERAAPTAMIVADMPFMSYATPDEALRNAGRLMGEAGAHMIKLEGGRAQLPVIHALVAQGVPVCGHLGLLPQSVHKMGGYRVQAKEKDQAQHLLEDAFALQDAGIDLLVLECIPALLATEVAENLAVPVIGIGAGSGCDGQILVLQDMLGMTLGKRPRFVKNFLVDGRTIQQAISAYVDEVKAVTFPTAEHSFETS